MNCCSSAKDIASRVSKGLTELQDKFANKISIMRLISRKFYELLNSTTTMSLKSEQST
jgi:hypothetical protein